MTLPGIGETVKVRNADLAIYEGVVTAHGLKGEIFWLQVLKVSGKDKPAGSYPAALPFTPRELVE
jgi:hypothetical protein